MTIAHPCTTGDIDDRQSGRVRCIPGDVSGAFAVTDQPEAIGPALAHAIIIIGQGGGSGTALPHSATMPHTRIEEIEGRRFLTFDLSDVRGDDEAMTEIAKVRRIIDDSPPKSLRVLTVVTGSRLSLTVIKALRDMAANNEPVVYRSAVVGLTVVHRAALQQIVEVADRDIREFSSHEEAMEWLSE
jgi:hypothetical protein